MKVMKYRVINVCFYVFFNNSFFCVLDFIYGKGDIEINCNLSIDYVEILLRV